MSPETILRAYPRQTAAASATALLLGIWLVRHLLLRGPDPEERERLRREKLAMTGRIVDGTLVDAAPTLAAPTVIQYRYRIAGVTYECSQDVSALSEIMAPLDLELPLQVRYRRDNPGDSIVISETWNGLWSVRCQTGTKLR